MNLIRNMYTNRIRASGEKLHLLMSEDMHNSLNGIRTMVLSEGIHKVEWHLIPVDRKTLRIDEDHYKRILETLPPGDIGLVLLTAQSNVSGMYTFNGLCKSTHRFRCPIQYRTTQTSERCLWVGYFARRCIHDPYYRVRSRETSIH
jgi:hypothetical protein